MRPPPLRRSLAGKLLGANLLVIVAGSATLALVALAIGPSVYHRHIRDALGVLPPGVVSHLDSAFGQSLALSLGFGILAAALTAALVSWAMAVRVVRPIRALASASRNVSRGDYSTRVTSSGDDEITVLAHAFNDMASSLASAERRRTELLADVAHELRTPLATVDAHLEGLEDGVVTPGPETWRLLRSETQRLRRLADDVGKISSAEERRLDLHVARVDPEELLASAAHAAAPAFTAKGVALEVRPSGTPVAVEVDHDRMIEVLSNLLTNALRHTPAGGAVTLEAARDGDEAVLSVTDTGEGLEPDQLGRVFERFYRADRSRSRERGGSGIGLTIARALVEAHGGTLSAESAGPGTGARFVCRLPAA